MWIVLITLLVVGLVVAGLVSAARSARVPLPANSREDSDALQVDASASDGKGAVAEWNVPVPRAPTPSKAATGLTMGSIYWGVLLANLTSGFLAWILYYLVTH